MSAMKYADVRLGTVEAVFNKLGGIEGVKRFLRSDAEVVITRHAIDLDADLFLPEGWEVVEHIRGGTLEWSPDAISLHLDEAQMGGRIGGSELRKRLKDKPVLNICALEYLHANPQLIPDEWKGKRVFFWGTIYRNRWGNLCVNSLRWSAGHWRWDDELLDEAWGVDDPAAVLAE